MRNILELSKHFALLARNLPASTRQLAFPFTTNYQKHRQTHQNFEDWEYCKSISSELKSGKISAALNLLFQVVLS
jgi:hypothetical protein